MGSRNRKKLAVEKRLGLDSTHIDTLMKELERKDMPQNKRNKRFRSVY